MATKSDLLPCPFCGGAPRFELLGSSQSIFDDDLVDPRCVIVCSACDSAGAIGDTEDQAVAAWNRRTNGGAS